MQNCKICGSALKQLFLTWYCPKDCDKATPVAKASETSKFYYGLFLPGRYTGEVWSGIAYVCYPLDDAKQVRAAAGGGYDMWEIAPAMGAVKPYVAGSVSISSGTFIRKVS